MATIQDQLDWEREMISRGITRFKEAQNSAVERDRAGETSAGSVLLKSYLQQASDYIRLYLDGQHPMGKRKHAIAKLIRTMDTDKLAYIGLKSMLTCVFNHEVTFPDISRDIGAKVEDEHRFARFERDHKAYYDEIIRRLDEKKNKNYSYKRASIIGSMRKQKQVEVKYWDTKTQIKLGSVIALLICEATDLFFIDQKRSKESGGTWLRPTPDCTKWVTEHEDAMSLLMPDRLPSLIQPEDWTNVQDGGYWSAELRSNTPLVIRGRFNTRKKLKRYLDADMQQVYDAVNAMQRTGWQVNERILDVMNTVWQKNLGTGMPSSQPYEIPKSPLSNDCVVKELDKDSQAFKDFLEWKSEARNVYELENERKAKLMGIARTLRMAREMKEHDAFWYVYRLDFRSRVYAATTGLSPQGGDHGKALLQFSEAKPLGPRGLYWLKVHGANKFGFDKEDYDTRVQWVEARHDKWIAVAADPIGNREHWQGADKPYQFLAFCFEYAQAAFIGEGFRSRLPIALDGSCNGLQHFSAMLRDAVGGKAVNLTDEAKPQDIYQAVANVFTRKLKGYRSLNSELHSGAANWLDLFTQMGYPGAPRKFAKPPVMTLPYGSTLQTCTKTTHKWYVETKTDFFPRGTEFKHAVYASPILWESIGEVVIAARGAQKWLQKCASRIGKAGKPLHWTTPLGFPVYHRPVELCDRRIETQLFGGVRIQIKEATDKIDVNRLRNGVSPNYVHSQDATHMMMVIIAAVAAGITSFAMIHDDFGTHACHIDDFHRIIRQEFIKLYDRNALMEWKEQQEQETGVELDEPPPFGTLDLQEVAKSRFFFG